MPCAEENRTHFYRNIEIDGNPIVEAIEQLQEDVEQLQEDVEQLQEDVTTIEEDISDIQDDIEELQADKWVFIGDSVGRTATRGGEEVTGWTDRVPGYLGLSQNQYYKVAIDGACFSSVSRPDLRFLTMLQGLNIPEAERPYIKHIVVCGGGNERDTTHSTIGEAVKDFATYVHNTFPNATFHLFGTAWSVVPTDREKEYDVFTIPYNGRMGQSDSGGYAYHFGAFTALQNKNCFTSDGHHPNNNGEYNLCQLIVSGLRGADVKWHSAETNLTIGGQVVGTARLCDSGVAVTIKAGSTVTFTAQNISGYKEIGTVSCPYIFGTNESDPYAVALHAMFTNTDNTSTYHGASLWFKYDNGTVRAMIRTSELISNVNKVQMEPTSFIIPWNKA